ncbi:DMT family transporter [Rickettsiales endosymbiont of Stachyamoeba lipophora]|uniref:DMT family transporter n=1 Tax=Rickettsiales endosymbiont of Stachyamoeba lipophora TaxID=2486578 RepID=UPI000F64F693|nr:EamA family transporter [Rickettsiales endosymbiont of Stachyamoeba lipophora]AZL15645.1 hypothetical protein EF513_03660 [Rickettsiales endosymbiont of Stachyamoeba lipophora]
MRLIDIFSIVFAYVLVGISYVIVLYGLDYFQPLTLIALRLTMIAAILVPFNLRVKTFPWKKVFIFGFINALGFQSLTVMAMYFGLDIATSVIAQQMHIPFSCIIGVLLLSEKLSNKTIIGLIIAFTGLVIMVGNPKLASNYGPVAMAIVSAFLYTISNFISKSIRNFNALSVIGYGALFALPFQYLLAYFVEGFNFKYVMNAPLSAWMSVFFLAVGVSIVSLSIWIEMLKKYPVQLVTPFSLLGPITGIICSMIILGEDINNYILIGTILTIAGISLIIIKFKILKFKFFK